MPRAHAANTDWMLPARYGLFMHYQYRIMLGYGGNGPYTGEPNYSSLTIEQFNSFVNGFDVNGFANQMQSGGAGWVIFGVDDALFGYCASPNSTLDGVTGPNHKHTSNRDLILELAQALHARGIRIIVYYAGLFNWTWDPTVWQPLGSDGNVDNPQTPASRQKRIDILAEYARRWGRNIDGWFLDEYRYRNYDDSNPLGAHPDLGDINAVLRGPDANPNAVITFSITEEGDVAPGIQDYAAGDTYTHLYLPYSTPYFLPGDPRQQWHLKMFCGDIYHGLGDSNYYSDSDLINWINTVNGEGGVVTMDWPFVPQSGLLKDFGIAQLQRIAQAVKGIQPPALPAPFDPTALQFNRTTRNDDGGRYK